MKQTTFSLLIVLSLLAITQSALIHSPKQFGKSLHDHFPSKNITNLQEIKTHPGFKALKANREASSGVISIAKIPELIRFWGNSVSFPKDQQAEMLRELNEARLNSIMSKKDGHVTLNWKWDNEEKVYNFKAITKPHPTSQGVA